MAENRRESPRFSVSLYAEQKAPQGEGVHIKNLSASGFLVQGSVVAGQGGIFHASFRVHPSTGDVRVSIRGRVVHCRHDGLESEFGIKIEGFGSQAEEEAYQTYIAELAERAGRPSA